MTLSASHCASDGEIGLLAPGISSQTFKGQPAATAMNAVHCVEIKKNWKRQPQGSFYADIQVTDGMVLRFMQLRLDVSCRCHIEATVEQRMTTALIGTVAMATVAAANTLTSIIACILLFHFIRRRSTCYLCG